MGAWGTFHILGGGGGRGRSQGRRRRQSEGQKGGQSGELQAGGGQKDFRISPEPWLESGGPFPLYFPHSPYP